MITARMKQEAGDCQTCNNCGDTCYLWAYRIHVTVADLPEVGTKTVFCEHCYEEYEECEDEELAA